MGRCASILVISDQVAAVARFPNGTRLVRIRAADRVVHYAVVSGAHGWDLGRLVCEKSSPFDDEFSSKDGREQVPDNDDKTSVDCMSCLVGVASWDLHEDR